MRVLKSPSRSFGVWLTALLLGLCALAPWRPAAAAQPDYYLHKSGSSLILNGIAPTASTDQTKNSSKLSFSSGNPWKAIATWTAAPALTTGTISALGDLHVWLGVTVTADQSAAFDVRAEVYKNGNKLIASGFTRCISGLSTSAGLAKEALVSFGVTPTAFNGTSDKLSLKILTRIGTNPDNSRCSVTSTATALRVFFDSVSKPSRIANTIRPVPTSLTPNPLSITVGATGNLTATISPAPNTAGTLAAQSAAPGIASVPSSIAVNAGQTSVAVPVTALATGSAVITVSLNGGNASSTVQVTPPPATISSLTPASMSITQGGSGTLTVTISAAQPTNTTVSVISSAPSNASVPTTVTVPAGQTTAPIPVTANTPGTANITASLNGSQATSTITVTAALPTVVSLVPATQTSR